MKDIFTKKWFTAAGIRALKTFAQTMVATIGGGAVGIMDVSWLQALSVSAMAAVLSLLTSIGGLPELDEQE
ncbi:MAG: holin [Clostridia bacterium]|nr:holin [Clostridia bacterium]